MTLSTPDAETIGVYDAKCDEYENMVARKREGREAVAVSQENSRATFLDGLPPNAKILDYGCGPGQYARPPSADRSARSGLRSRALTPVPARRIVHEMTLHLLAAMRRSSRR